MRHGGVRQATMGQVVRGEIGRIMDGQSRIRDGWTINDR